MNNGTWVVRNQLTKCLAKKHGDSFQHCVAVGQAYNHVALCTLQGRESDGQGVDDETRLLPPAKLATGRTDVASSHPGEVESSIGQSAVKQSHPTIGTPLATSGAFASRHESVGSLPPFLNDGRLERMISVLRKTLERVQELHKGENENELVASRRFFEKVCFGS